jgi:dihydrofolate reductase
MRTVTFGVANSLDNYIAGRDGALDWLHWSKDVNAIMAAFWKTIDTIVMGRKTYDFARRSSPKKNPYSGMKTYVFSRTLKPGSGDGVEIVAEDAGDFVRKLKAHPGKGICVLGGGDLARALLEAGVIDEVGLNVHPVLLGSGVPLFLEMTQPVQLELIKCQTLEGGCVLLSYRVKK